MRRKNTKLDDIDEVPLLIMVTVATFLGFCTIGAAVLLAKLM
jgi:hypothetical protein